MKGLTLTNVCQCGVFAHLVLFSFMSITAAVSFDLTELRNKVAKIKVNPRGNLWATGHFMGKKSVVDGPDEAAVDALDLSLPAQQSAIGELFQEFLQIVLQTEMDAQASRSKNQEADLLMKILESYIDSRK